MGSLRSAFDEFAAHELRFASDDELSGDLDELERVAGSLEVERSRRIVELERRAAFAVDGHRSMAAWLASRFHLAWSLASRRVHRSRALEEMPVVTRALAERGTSRCRQPMSSSRRVMLTLIGSPTSRRPW